MTTPPARLRTDQALEAAGYVRVSRKEQAEGHSPEVQRDAIKRLAAEQGYALTVLEEDHERGSKVSREGYQRIIEGVRRGTIHAVIVYMFDRFGRDGGEWITRARELERLGIPLISVQEGRDEAGMLRFIRAGMAEEYSRQLAKRVRDNREKGAKQGIHQGRTPYGYLRLHPAWDGRGRQPPADLMPAEPAAWVVRELFSRYAGGGWALRDLVRWLATDPRCAATPTGKPWNLRTVANILHSPVYKGEVRYNSRPQGLYERAAPGSAFVAPGRHAALVSPEQWEAANHRLAAARKNQTHNRRVSRSGLPVALGAGIILCSDCGGRMYRHFRDDPYQGLYICLTRHAGTALCTGRAVGATIAHAALLSEVRRLRGAPWTPQAEQRLLGTQGADVAAAATATARALDVERENLRRYTRRITLMEEDPTPEQIASFREVSAEISARMRALEAQLATATERAAQVPRLRDLHTMLTQTEIPALVERLEGQNDQAALRALVQGLVTSAQIAERVPGYRTIWVRLAVTWPPEVQTLLAAGLLWLDAPDAPPDLHRTRRMEMNRLAQQRYRARKRAAQQGMNR